MDGMCRPSCKVEKEAKFDKKMNKPKNKIGGAHLQYV